MNKYDEYDETLFVRRQSKAEKRTYHPYSRTSSRPPIAHCPSTTSCVDFINTQELSARAYVPRMRVLDFGRRVDRPYPKPTATITSCSQAAPTWVMSETKSPPEAPRQETTSLSSSRQDVTMSSDVPLDYRKFPTNESAGSSVVSAGQEGYTKVPINLSAATSVAAADQNFPQDYDKLPSNSSAGLTVTLADQDHTRDNPKLKINKSDGTSVVMTDQDQTRDYPKLPTNQSDKTPIMSGELNNTRDYTKMPENRQSPSINTSDRAGQFGNNGMPESRPPPSINTPDRAGQNGKYGMPESRPPPFINTSDRAGQRGNYGMPESRPLASINISDQAGQSGNYGRSPNHQLKTASTISGERHLTEYRQLPQNLLENPGPSTPRRLSTDRYQLPQNLQQNPGPSTSRSISADRYQLPLNLQENPGSSTSRRLSTGHYQLPQNLQENQGPSTSRRHSTDRYQLSPNHQENSVPSHSTDHYQVSPQQEAPPSSPNKDESAEMFGSLLATHLKKLTGANRLKAEKRLFDCLDTVRSQCAENSGERQNERQNDNANTANNNNNVKKEPQEVIELDSPLESSDTTSQNSDESSQSSPAMEQQHLVLPSENQALQMQPQQILEAAPLEEQPWFEDLMPFPNEYGPLEQFLESPFVQQLSQQSMPSPSALPFMQQPYFPENIPTTVVTDINLSYVQLQQSMLRPQQRSWLPMMRQRLAPPVIRPQGPLVPAPRWFAMRPGFRPFYDNNGQLYHTNGRKLIPGDFDATDFDIRC